MTDSFIESLEARGLTRRAFLAFCGTIAAAIGVEGIGQAEVAEAIESNWVGNSEGNLAPVIWMELGSCTGCTESFAQSAEPDPATLLLEYLALNYSETLGAAAGETLEQCRKQTIENNPGKYILVVEGAVMTGWNGDALRIAGEATCAPGESPLLDTAKHAAAVISAGSCAVDGGMIAGVPNPAGAEGVQKYLSDNGVTDVPVVNLPSCPVNPSTLVAVICQYLLLGTLPALDGKNKPTAYYSETIHDNCQRRGHFENGEFVYQFGSKEEALGYCLYPVGCKGPQTSANCSTIRWNRRTSWCIDAGAPCIGCATANPGCTQRNWFDVSAPFTKRMKNIRIGDLFFQPTTAALIVTGVVVVVLVVHGIGMKATGRTSGGADFEEEREWVVRHEKKAEKKQAKLEAKEAQSEDAPASVAAEEDDDQEGGE